MIRIAWDLEEVIVLIDAYIRNGQTLSIPDEELDQLRKLYLRRAKALGYVVDDKFRNRSGLRMQMAGLHYIFTDGAAGLSNVSKIFYKAVDLYRKKPNQFERQKEEFYRKYKE